MSRPTSRSRGGAGRAEPGARRPASGYELVKTTLSERTYEALKERILDQNLKAGDRLNIDALSRELRVSSSPVREALVRLESERLIVSELYAGYSVAPAPSAKYLRDLLDYRSLVEGHCARIGAPKKKRSIVAALRREFEKMSQPRRIGVRYSEYRSFVRADGKFHQILVDSAENTVFSDVYESLHALILQSRLYLSTRNDESRLSEVLQEHRRILTAFEEGDGLEAEAAVRAHLDGGRRRLLHQPEKLADEAIA